MMQFIRVLIAYIGAAVAAIAESIIIDPETVGASLIVSLFTLPSIILYVIVERLSDRFWAAKDIVFVLSLVPLTAYMMFVTHDEGEASDIAELIGLTYVSEALAAYLALLGSARVLCREKTPRCKKTAPNSH